MDTAQGPGRRMVSSVGIAVRRIPPGTPGWAAALLVSTPRARRPWTRSARHPRALSLKAIWEGVLLPRACSPLPEHLCATEAGRSFPHPAWRQPQQPPPAWPSWALQPGLHGARWSPSGPHLHPTCVITRVPLWAQTHRPQLQWQTRSSPRRCGRM